MHYSIGEVAEKLNLPKSTIRYYDKEGLLPFVERKESGIRMFQLLDLHDFPGQSTATIGILNSFWKSKGLISESSFREFCSPAVPLLITDKRIYHNGEQFNAQIQISNFGPVDLKDSTIKWEIKFTNGDIFVKDELKGICLPQGTLTNVGEIKELSFGAVDKASQLTVNIGIEGDQMFRSILKYMASENFIPEKELELDVLKNLFKIHGENVDNVKEIDLAMGRAVCSDSEKSAIYSAYRGDDGNPTTCWCAADADTGHWWQVDLGEIC